MESCVVTILQNVCITEPLAVNILVALTSIFATGFIALINAETASQKMSLNEKKWKISEQINLLKSKGEKLGEIQKQIIQYVEEGIVNGADVWNVEMWTDMHIFFPKAVLDEFRSRIDKLKELQSGSHEETEIFNAKKSILWAAIYDTKKVLKEIDDRIEDLLT